MTKFIKAEGRLNDLYNIQRKADSHKEGTLEKWKYLSLILLTTKVSLSLFFSAFEFLIVY